MAKTAINSIKIASSGELDNALFRDIHTGATRALAALTQECGLCAQLDLKGKPHKCGCGIAGPPRVEANIVLLRPEDATQISTSHFFIGNIDEQHVEARIVEELRTLVRAQQAAA